MTRQGIERLFATAVTDLDTLLVTAPTQRETTGQEVDMVGGGGVEMKEVVCAIVVTGWDTLPGSAPMERGVTRGVEDLFATSAIESGTLQENVQRGMTILEEERKEEETEILTEQVDQSVISATGLDILPVIAMKTRTGATSATGPGTLRETAARRRRRATTATRPGTS